MKSPQEIIDFVHDNIDGRMCDEYNNVHYLANFIFNADGGNYLEIGSLFGGTAIVASLVMQDLELEGEVYAIDPFDGYYIGTKNERSTLVGAQVDPHTRKAVTLERAQANAEKMGAKVNFIKGKSSLQTVPDVRFSVVYIDGDHWNDAPWKDWLLVKDKCDKFIIFDNCDTGHPAVESAVRNAWEDGEWTLLYKSGVTAVLGRIGNV